jgi:hypothetical protein
MALSLRYPPTLHSLLDDPAYEAYFRRSVKLPPSPSTSPPWQMMAHTTEGKWKKGFFDNFTDARARALAMMEDPAIRDICIISRRKLFKTPSLATTLMSPGDEWCGRCRRPTHYRQYGSKHPALGHAPVIVGGATRCYFCGMQPTQR